MVTTEPQITSAVPRELTEPKEFHLESVRRSQVAKIHQQMRLEQDEIEAAKLREASVKAAPMPDFSHPFKPQPSDKELTEFKLFELESLDRHERAKEERK